MLMHILLSAAAIALSDPPREPVQGATGGTQPAARKKLAPGDQAPPMSVDFWAKGDELSEFETGKAYVIEFWATWSPPCKKAIGTLNGLAKKYPEIRIAGIAASEKAPDKDKEDFRLATVNGFVKERGDGIAYSIGYDGDETMNRTWMEPAGQSGIPTVFVVDGKGRVVWIGSPTHGLDEVLAKVALGTYDVEKMKQVLELKQKATDKLEHGEFEEGILILDRAFKLDPSNTAAVVLKFNTLLMKIKSPARASAFGRECVDGSLKNDEAALEQIMRSIVMTPGLESRDFALAAKAGERAAELAGTPSPKLLEILANAYRGSGDKAKSIATLQKAIAASDGTMKEVLTDTLEAWKKDAEAK